MTRRNDTDLAVANRDTWTVTGVRGDGALVVTGEHGDRVLPADYVRHFVELGYATTVHGAQGDTATTAHLLVGEHTGAASAYVGMTRGREANVAHLVADNIDDAREQWVAVFARDRSDLGPAHAARLAEIEAARYAEQRPLDVALIELRAAWTVEQDNLERLTAAEQRHDLLLDVVALTRERDTTVPALEETYHDAWLAAQDAQLEVQRLETVLSAHADDFASVLQREWDAQREPARHAARTVGEGTGWLGRGRRAAVDADQHLQQWASRWRPYLPDYLPAMPIATSDIVAFAGRYDHTPGVHDALHQYARLAAEQAHPDYADARTDAASSTQRRDQAWHAWRDTRDGLDQQLSSLGRLAHHPDPARLLTDADGTITASQAQYDTAQQRVAALLAESALRSLPLDRLASEREQWAADRDHAAEQRLKRSAQRSADTTYRPAHRHQAYQSGAPQRGPGRGR